MVCFISQVIRQLGTRLLRTSQVDCIISSALISRYIKENFKMNKSNLMRNLFEKENYMEVSRVLDRIQELLLIIVFFCSTEVDRFFLKNDSTLVMFSAINFDSITTVFTARIGEIMALPTRIYSPFRLF